MRSTLFAFFTLSIHIVAYSQDSSDAEYQLVWADEFDVAGEPDPRNWTYERGFVRNRELQWYQPENAVCRDGRLVIEGRRQRLPNPRYEVGSRDWKKRWEFAEFTSACLLTRGRHSWQYGRFEVKAKIKASDGLWPAIWFLGDRGQWPSCGEIDLMEFYRGDILANACWGTETRWQARWDSSKTPVESFGDPQWDEKFHVWRMDWDAERIELFVDDQLLNTIDVTKTLNPAGRGPENPFRQPHYLLLNLAIGGTQGGDPTETDFPTLYEIDYVRVYQRAASGK